MTECTEVQTPNGENTLRVELTKLNPENLAYSIMLLYNYKGQKLKAGTEYEISFQCKSSDAGSLFMVCGQGQAPYAELRGCKTPFVVTREWRTVKFKFKPQKDAIAPLHIPRIFLGDFKKRATFHFGPLSLRVSPDKLPLAINKSWKLFCNTALPVKLNKVPTLLDGKTAKTIKLVNNAIDISAYSAEEGEKRRAILFNEFESSKTGVMMMGLSADWWMRVWINGQKVMDTCDFGNQSHKFIPDDHVIELPVRKGSNVIAVEILSGSAGWKMVCGIPARPADDSCFITRINSNFKPIELPRTVIKGSVLDFSTLGLQDAPAGKYGHVIVRDGYFSFENAPDKKIRFLGGNVCYRLCFPEKKNAVKLADILAACGYNAVRFHHFDFALISKKNPTVPNPEVLKRMDYFIKLLSDRGIYVTIDLQTMWTRYAVSDKGLFDILWDNEVRNKWFTYVKNLLNHVNEYTGFAWKDDPAISTINSVNEDSPFFYTGNIVCPPQMEKAFNSYLEKHDGDKTSIEKRKELFEKFVIEKHPEKFAEIRKFLHALGVKAPLTDINVWSSPAMTLMRDSDNLDYVDNHFYWNHPGSLYNDWKPPFVIGQESALSMFGRADSFFLPGPFAARVLGKPYTISEFNFCNPTRFRGESGAIIGAYAALQDWNGLYRFTFGGDLNQLEECSTTGLNFDIINDPINLLADRLIALLFLRGDVALSDIEFPIIVPENYLDSVSKYRKKGLGRGGIFPPEMTMLAFVGRIGSMAERNGKSYLPTGKQTSFRVDKELNSSQIIKAVSKNSGFGKGMLDPIRKRAISSTGELRLDSLSELLTISTKRTNAIVSTKAGVFRAGPLYVNNHKGFLSFSVSSLDNLSVSDSKRLLVMHITNAIPSDMVFSGEDMNMAINKGKMPYLARRGVADITIKMTPGATPNIYGVDLGGNRLGKVKSCFKDGILSFTADSFLFKTPCFVYEITR